MTTDTLRRGARPAVVGLVATAAAVACGSSASQPDPKPVATVAGSPVAAPPAGPVTSAAGTRDYLLGLAPRGTRLDNARATAVGDWATSLPALHFIGSSLPATPTSVSGFAFSRSQAKQVQYLAFAVADTAGHCAAGVLELSDGDSPMVTAGRPLDASVARTCSADAISEAAGY